MQEITPNVNEEKAAAEVHSYIKDMVAKYHHRPIPTTPAAGNVKTYYRDKLPAWAKKKISRKSLMPRMLFPIKWRESMRTIRTYCNW